jgi:hypothetical protein
MLPCVLPSSFAHSSRRDIRGHDDNAEHVSLLVCETMMAPHFLADGGERGEASTIGVSMGGERLRDNIHTDIQHAVGHRETAESSQRSIARRRTSREESSKRANHTRTSAGPGWYPRSAGAVLSVFLHDRVFTLAMQVPPIPRDNAVSRSIQNMLIFPCQACRSGKRRGDCRSINAPSHARSRPIAPWTSRWGPGDATPQRVGVHPCARLPPPLV